MKKFIDNKKAQSLLEAAKNDLDFALSLELTKEASSTIIRNIYESFRMLGSALLILKGINANDHVLPINELTNLNLDTKRPLALIDSLRKLRHNINYNGYKANLEEAKDVIDLAEKCFPLIYEEVKNRIN